MRRQRVEHKHTIVTSIAVTAVMADSNSSAIVRADLMLLRGLRTVCRVDVDGVVSPQTGGYR
jgi:hypothetical protein